MNKKQKKVLFRIILSAVLTAVICFIPVRGIYSFALFMIPYLIIGHDILRKAGKGILRRQIFDENFLMAIATIGALVIALTETGDYLEAVAVMLFYQVGEFFQSIAVGKSRRNIYALMDIRPDYANIEKDGTLIQVSPDEVAVGDIIVVQPGEKVPLDGVSVEGHASLNTAPLTGESLPREVQEGDSIISGAIDLNGVLKIKTTKCFEESTVSKILDLVENASSRKSRPEAFITKFAAVYTPVVCLAALALAVLPPLVCLMMGTDALWNVWCYRALSFLVISCPCALVISIPLSFFAGIGGASHAGILIKGSNFLEALSKVDAVVLDKTGTLTKGVFEVTDIHHNTLHPDKLLELAALTESASSHPIAKSIVAAYGKDINRSRVTDITEYSGGGITATVDGKSVAVGNDKLMAQTDISIPACNCAGTIIHIAIDGKYAGHLVISDRPKDTAAASIAGLKKSGVNHIVMLTGDNHVAAANVATAVGIDSYHASLLPADKVEKVEQLITAGHRVAFVGDGINDAPVLSRADIGIAMGAMGSDAAIEAADVVLMDDDPEKLVTALRISKKCLRIVYQNIVFALGIKILCLILGAVGITGMWAAIFADVGVMVVAVLNALRTLWIN